MANNISTDEKQRETLAVLQEALDYLRRLPPVPVTIEMCGKLQRHLELPTNRLVAQQQDTWIGASYQSSGLCYLTARLKGHVLEVKLPDPDTRASHKHIEQVAIERLRSGVIIQLENLGFDPFSGAEADRQ